MAPNPKIRASKAREVQRKLEKRALPETKSETKALISDVKSYKAEHNRLLELHVKVHEGEVNTESIKKDIVAAEKLINMAEPTRSQKAKAILKKLVGKTEPDQLQPILINRRDRLYKDLALVFDLQNMGVEERKKAIEAMEKKQQQIETYLERLGLRLQELKQ